MRARVLAVGAAALLAGCGGGSADESAARQTVQRWSDAVLDRDSSGACTELSSKLRKQIERHLLGEGVRGSCRTWAARYVSPRHPASRPHARVISVRIAGPRATAKLAAPGAADGNVLLVKERGRWRIDDY